MARDAAACAKNKHLGKYEIGKTLGEGNFGKVKYARNVNTGNEFAIKILDKRRILSLKIDDQIKREIGTLQLLRHPNVIRLHEVLASKSKIYMVLDYAMGGELFDKIALNGRYRENEGRKLFQQLIDAISYCHEKGVYHRDLKPENVLVDMEGCIKISDFGLSALHQHIGNDGMLHTTCGSPNYVAPEVLSNRGYDGALSDIWSCGVILYVVLTGYLPFDDRNLAVLYQKIFKGNVQIPKRLSPGAKNMIKKILDPNPNTRIKMDEIKSDDWFQQGYIPVVPEDENGIYNYHDDTFFIDEQSDSDSKGSCMPNGPNHINAFQLIGMSSCLDLSGLFEKDHVSERKVVFASNHCSKDLPERIKCISVDNGFEVTERNKKLKIMQRCTSSSKPCGLFSAAAEVFEISPFVSVVEISKFHGDSSLYRELCTKLSNELGMVNSTVM